MERRQIEQELLNTRSPEDVVSVFKEAGMEISEDTAKNIAAKVSLAQKESGSVLSEDELSTVSGGRDFGEEGCAATVEYGSSCCSEDGGCILIHYTYIGGPSHYRCRKCGQQQLYLIAWHDGVYNSIDRFRCRVCGQKWDSWMLEEDD